MKKLTKPMAEKLLAKIFADRMQLQLDVALCMKKGLGDDGRELWEKWSAQSDIYNDEQRETIWSTLPSAKGLDVVETLRGLAKLTIQDINQRFPAVLHEERYEPTAPYKGHKAYTPVIQH